MINVILFKLHLISALSLLLYYFFFCLSLHVLLICILFMARSFPLLSVDPVDRDIHKETHDYN